MPLYKIKNAVVWGNHSPTQVPDVSHAYVESFAGPGLHEPVRTALNNETYMHQDFVKTVQKRVGMGLSRALRSLPLVSCHQRQAQQMLLATTFTIGLLELKPYVFAEK